MSLENVCPWQRPRACWRGSGHPARRWRRGSWSWFGLTNRHLRGPTSSPGWVQRRRQPGLGSCVQIVMETLTTNGRPSDRADLAELAELKCIGGIGMPGHGPALADGFPQQRNRQRSRPDDLRDHRAGTVYLHGEEGFGSFFPFGGTARFTFATLAKLTKGASYHCTIGREIIGEAAPKAHAGENDESEPVELQTLIVG